MSSYPGGVTATRLHICFFLLTFENMFFRLTCRALQPHTTHYLTPIFSIHTFALNADGPLQLMLKLNLDCTIILEMLTNTFGLG